MSAGELARRSSVSTDTLRYYEAKGDQLAEILRVRDRGGAPCRKVREIAAAKLESVESRLRELLALRDELRVTLKDWDVRLAKTPNGRRSRLLESLNSDVPRQRPSGRPFTTTAVMTNRRKNP
jgi:DNA-binding transcriptional MerR regulator